MLSTKQLAQESGLTLRQLQWLDDQEIVVPTRGKLSAECARRGGRTDCRLYTDDQVRRVKTLGELRSKGLSLSAATRILNLCWDTLSRSRGPAYLLVDARNASGHNGKNGTREAARVVFGERKVVAHLCEAAHGTILLKFVH